MRKKMRPSTDKAVFRRTAIVQKKENVRMHSRGSRRF